MDYKKLILYIVILAVGLGVWYKDRLDEKDRQRDSERFAQVYAATTVMASLYRNEPDQFFRIRDSIMAAHAVDTAWVHQFKHSHAGDEEKWAAIWSRIHDITDSLIDHFEKNSIDHDSTSASETDEPDTSAAGDR